jgi:hypothetical protein
MRLPLHPQRLCRQLSVELNSGKIVVSKTLASLS